MTEAARVTGHGAGVASPLSQSWAVPRTLVPSYRLKQNLRQEEVSEKNDERRAHDGVRRRSADAFRAAARVVAAHAARQGQNESECSGLDRAAPHVPHR